jgi:hypothetical protein
LERHSQKTALRHFPDCFREEERKMSIRRAYKHG